MNQQYLTALKRLEKDGINCDGKSLLIINYGARLNGDCIDGYKISKDEKWVCLPVHDEQAEIQTGEYCFKPQCFEILEKFETYLPTSDMLVLSQVYLLN